MKGIKLYIDGKYEKIVSTEFPTGINRNINIENRIKYEGKLDFSEVNKVNTINKSDKVMKEIIPLKYYDKYGYKLNMIFLSGKEFDEESYANLLPKQNIYAIYFVKVRCPCGPVYIYNEDQKNDDKLVDNKLIDNKTTDNKSINESVNDKQVDKSINELVNDKIINNEITTDKQLDEYIDNLMKDLIEKGKMDPSKISEKLSGKIDGSRKNQVKKLIDKIRDTGCIHHEAINISITPNFMENYVKKKRLAYYDFFNSYAIKYGESYPIGLLIGKEGDMKKSYNKGLLKFKKNDTK